MRNVHSRRLAAATLFLALAFGLSTASPIRAAAAEAKVTIDNFTFDPPKLTVKAGTIVTWVNRDDIPHTVASSTRVFKSKALDTDNSFTFTFTTPGSYAYFCSLHPHMTGTIVVEAPSAAQ
jgi:plastocyanin